MGTKICPSCLVPREYKLFSSHTAAGPRLVRLYCVECRTTKRKAARDAISEPVFRAIADARGLGPMACTVCGDTHGAWKFVVARLDGAHPHISRKCGECRRKKVAVNVKRRRAVQTTTDWFAAAEHACYPGVPYLAMTDIQRGWAYIVARRWWLEGGFGSPFGIDMETERDKLAKIERMLLARTDTPLPFPAPSLRPIAIYAHDYPDPDRRNAGRHGPRTVRGRYRHPESQEGQDAYAVAGRVRTA